MEAIFDSASLIARVALGAVLIVAGLSKLRDAHAFISGLSEFPVARSLARSATATRVLAAAVLSTELIVGLCLVSGLLAPYMAFIAAVMLGVFTAALIIAVVESKAQSCGCFGTKSKSTVHRMHVVRNVLLMSLAVLVGSSGITQSDVIGPSHTSFIVLAAMTIGTLGLVAWRTNSSPVLNDEKPLIASLQDNPLTYYSEAARAPSSSAESPPLAVSGRQFSALGELETLEREACSLIMSTELGSTLAGGTTDHTSTDIDEELLQLDEELNEKFAAAFREADQEASSSGLVGLSLLLWTTLLRRRSMVSLHTKVNGLSGRRVCKGDLIGETLLWQYFRTLMPLTDASVEANQVAAIKALAAVARQAACLGERQNAWLASNLYWSFVEVRAYLRQNALEFLTPFLAQAGAAPLLLIYDVEKYRGLTSPLARWFQENREWLFQGESSGRLPVLWHGLWLYDRRTGHLLGFAPSDVAIDENEVNLGSFFDSIINPDNLGRRDCTFSEMIERGQSRAGYHCLGSVCEEVRQSRPSDRFDLWTRVSSLGTRGDMNPRAVEETLCQSGSKGGQSSQCGDGLSGAGRSWSAKAVRCLSEQVITPSERILRCVGESLGLCASPVDAYVKRLAEVSLAGVPLGGCDLKSSGATTEEERWREVVEADRKAEAETDRAVEAAVKEYKNEVQAIEDAHQTAYEIFADSIQDPKVLGAALAGADDARKSQLDQATEKRDQTIKEAYGREEDAKQKAREQYDNDSKKKQSRRCPPDVPECGDDSCSAMAASAKATMRCLTAQTEKKDLTQMRGQEGWTDPSPLDDSSDTSWTRCLEGLARDGDLQRKCWAVDCGPEFVTALQDGVCNCASTIDHTMSSALGGVCGNLDCLEGHPSIQNGRCTCAKEPVGELGLVTFKLPPPPIFSEVHAEVSGVGYIPRGSTSARYRVQQANWDITH